MLVLWLSLRAPHVVGGATLKPGVESDIALESGAHSIHAVMDRIKQQMISAIFTMVPP